MVEIRPEVACSLTRAWTLEVHDLVNPRIERRHVDGAGSLDQHREAVVEKHLRQDESIAMDGRLAAGNLDEVGTNRPSALEQILQCDLVAAEERILGITPDA